MKKQKSKWKIVAGIILICQLMVSIIAVGLAKYVTNEIYAVSCFNPCVAFDNCLLFFLFEG